MSLDHGAPRELGNREFLHKLISEELARINGIFSPYEKGSRVSQINAAAGGDWVSIDNETLKLISSSLKISRESGGAFDITVGPLVDLFGFGPKRVSGLPSKKEIGKAMGVVGRDKIQVRREPPAVKKKYGAVEINLSAIAKGYAVDRVSLLLESRGLLSYMVEVGGEVRVGKKARGDRKWKIGVSLPETMSGKLLRVLEIENTAVATSGEYNNFRIVDGRRVSHTINPSTGAPIDHDLASVTVLAPSCEIADACATAINVLGAERGLDFARKKDLALLLVVRRGEKFEVVTNKKFDMMFGLPNKKEER